MCGSAKEEAAGSVAAVHPCPGAQGLRGTLVAQPSAASPGGPAPPLLTLSLSSIISWGRPRGVHTGGDRDQMCEQTLDPEGPAGLLLGS